MQTATRRKIISEIDRRIIDFKFAEKDYKIDLSSNRVYRNWVSVEAQQRIAILSAYRHTTPLGS